MTPLMAIRDNKKFHTTQYACSEFHPFDFGVALSDDDIKELAVKIYNSEDDAINDGWRKCFGENNKWVCPDCANKMGLNEGG